MLVEFDAVRRANLLFRSMLRDQLFNCAIILKVFKLRQADHKTVSTYCIQSNENHGHYPSSGSHRHPSGSRIRKLRLCGCYGWY